MSRIRGIVQKEVLQTRKYELNEILNKKNEDQSANSKDDVEKYQIKELLHKLPRLDKIFEVHRKIGEGTFSSVYLGSLRQHATLSDSEKRWFAIKHLVPTAHPARIEHELRCLQDMGGKHHVIGVELCLRNLDSIVFIMPYIPHRKFSEYVGEMDAAELRQYMRALMVALRHVHSFGVIHRDVKPSNFLYDRENKRTNYRKEHKKVENSKKSRASINDVYVPSLWYYDKLHFIRDQETPRASQSNLAEESTTEETEGVETDGVEIYTESSDAVQSPQTSTSSTVVQSLHLPTPSRNRSRPTKRTISDSVTEDVLLSVRDHFKRPAVLEDGCDVFGKMVAIKLRDLPREQRLFAEKIITDTLFETQFGNLTISHKLTSSTLLNQVPQQIHQQQMLSEPQLNLYSNNRSINYNLQSQQSQPT